MNNYTFDSIHFEEINFSGFEFKDCLFQNCNFIKCNLENSKWDGTSISQSIFDVCNLDYLKFHNSTIVEVEFGADSYQKITFSHTLLTKCSFSSSKEVLSLLDNDEYQRYKKKKSTNKDWTLHNCNISSTKFEYLTLENMIIMNCVFYGFNLLGTTHLKDVTFSNNKFLESNIHPSILDNVRWIKNNFSDRFGGIFNSEINDNYFLENIFFGNTFVQNTIKNTNFMKNLMFGEYQHNAKNNFENCFWNEQPLRGFNR